MTSDHRDDKECTKEQYASIAGGGSCCASGETLFDPIEQAKSIGYSDQEIKSVPTGTIMGLGSANPTVVADLTEGETVLDVGCGGGLDASLAAQRVGQKGKVIGVDMTAEMIEKARDAAARGHCKNVVFRLGEMDSLPVEDESVDVVISNCVINHAPNKLAAFKEVCRCLKPNGRMVISDLETAGEFSAAPLRDEVWGEWIAGALGKDEYLEAIGKAGFRDIAVLAETPFGPAEEDDTLKGRIASIQVKAYR